jgi:hypothetical protein
MEPTADCVDGLIGQMERMSLIERGEFWDEFTTRPDLWGEEGAR